MFSVMRQTAKCYWLNSSLRRNTEVSVRRAKVLLLPRAQGMNRKNAEIFFYDKVVTKIIF
jgi:hypothetical protein